MFPSEDMVSMSVFMHTCYYVFVDEHLKDANEIGPICNDKEKSVSDGQKNNKERLGNGKEKINAIDEELKPSKHSNQKSTNRSHSSRLGAASPLKNKNYYSKGKLLF